MSHSTVAGLISMSSIAAAYSTGLMELPGWRSARVTLTWPAIFVVVEVRAADHRQDLAAVRAAWRRARALLRSCLGLSAFTCFATISCASAWNRRSSCAGDRQPGAHARAAAQPRIERVCNVVDEVRHAG